MRLANMAKWPPWTHLLVIKLVTAIIAPWEIGFYWAYPFVEAIYWLAYVGAMRLLLSVG